jgi:hypothetical protein
MEVPAAAAQAGSALILEEVNRPTVQLAFSAASPRSLFVEFGGHLQVGELPTDVNGASLLARTRLVSGS